MCGVLIGARLPTLRLGDGMVFVVVVRLGQGGQSEPDERGAQQQLAA